MLRLVRSCWTAALSVILLAGYCLAKPGHGHGHGYGRSHGVPELDPGSIASALTLLIGAVLIMRDRKRQ
jgi:hypothetical protein